MLSRIRGLAVGRQFTPEGADLNIAGTSEWTMDGVAGERFLGFVANFHGADVRITCN
jgi:hypothetical protein